MLLQHLSDNQDAFTHCPELQAVHLEILNLLSSFGYHSHVARANQLLRYARGHGSSSALLNLHRSLMVVHDTVSSGDVEGLRMNFLATLNSDVNTASRILEAIPQVWKSVDNVTTNRALCGLYLEACTVSSAPEIRTQALTNLALLMDGALNRGELAALPSIEELDRLWVQLQGGDISPGLSCAAIQTSGAIMAALVALGLGNTADKERRLRSWGDMLSEGLDVDNVSQIAHLELLRLDHYSQSHYYSRLTQDMQQHQHSNSSLLEPESRTGTHSISRVSPHSTNVSSMTTRMSGKSPPPLPPPS